MTSERASNWKRGREPHRFWFSAGLGLLTLGTTPLVGTLLVLPFAVLSKVSAGLNPIVMLARLFHLENDELSGYFLAVILLCGALALLGDLAAASISWFLNRSMRSALITFMSACLVQLGMFTFAVPLLLEHSSEEGRRAGEVLQKFDSSFEEVATIGNAAFELQSRYGKTAYNPHPEYGPMYRNLEFRIPVFVSRAGTYRIEITYGYSKDGFEGHSKAKEITSRFDPGGHLVTALFAPWDAGTYGYWSPRKTAGKCQIQVFYLASRREVDEMLKTDPRISKGWLEGFHRAARDTDENSPEPSLPKFVARSETSF
jgi:hypothetical protein